MKYGGTVGFSRAEEPTKPRWALASGGAFFPAFRFVRVRAMPAPGAAAASAFAVICSREHHVRSVEIVVLGVERRRLLGIKLHAAIVAHRPLMTDHWPDTIEAWH